MRVVIIGNGVAGVTTARYIAERDPSAEITIYTKESFEYYPRPRLIDFVNGSVSVREMPQYGARWYQQRLVETVLCKEAVAIDRVQKAVHFADGDGQPYDHLVLATGARQWIPPMEGAGTKGIHTLRTLEDAIRICQDARDIGHVMVLGGGLLGLDTAMALKAHDVDITVVEALSRLLPRQLDTEGAALLQRKMASRGVQVIVDDLCQRIEGRVRVERAYLRSGREIDTDAVLVSAGIRTNLALAQCAGLQSNRGILVNDRMQTSDPAIYAVGDAAEFAGIVWGIIPAALAQARVAAAQITGNTDVRYTDIVPSTTLQVTGIDLTAIGEVNPEGGQFDQVRYLDDAQGIFKKVVIRDGKVVGAILLGDRSDVGAMNRLISQRIIVTEVQDELLDPSFDLTAFARKEMPQQ